MRQGCRFLATLIRMLLRKLSLWLRQRRWNVHRLRQRLIKWYSEVVLSRKS